VSQTFSFRLTFTSSALDALIDIPDTEWVFDPCEYLLLALFTEVSLWSGDDQMYKRDSRILLEMIGDISGLFFAQ
jgi:hypothetical protein